MSNLALIADVAIGYAAGKLLWEFALAGAHHAGRLSVRLVMNMARQGEVKPAIVAEVEN